jgi:hypothetical protein
MVQFNDDGFDRTTGLYEAPVKCWSSPRIGTPEIWATRRTTQETPTMKSKRPASRNQSATADAPPDARFVALCKTLAADPKYARAIGEYAANRASPARRQFGSNALKVNGKIFAMMSQGTLVVKLPRARVDELIEAASGTRFDPGHGRLMKEWLAISAPTRAWAALVREAHDFVAGGGTSDRAKGVGR